MAGKMQPGRFTLRLNVNDPQQQMAVDILNRQGRQKAQFLAQALIHYMECQQVPHAQEGNGRCLNKASMKNSLTCFFKSM